MYSLSTYVTACVVFSVLLPLGHSGVPCLQAGCFSKHSSQKNQAKAAEERGSFLGLPLHVALYCMWQKVGGRGGGGLVQARSMALPYCIPLVCGKSGS